MMNTSNNAPLDQQVLMDLKEATEEMFPEIIEVFLEDTPSRIQRLNAAIQETDFEMMTEESHSIKGSSSNIGALTLSALCAEIEKQSRTNRLIDQNRLIDELKVEFSRVQKKLNEALVE